MAIRAYDEEYLLPAQRVMGDMFDFAIVTLGIDADEFASAFLSSHVSEQISYGNPAYVAGRNGCELVRMIADSCGMDIPDVPDEMHIDKSPEFWAGWSLAYYQWEKGIAFDEILDPIPLSDLIIMYDPYHEMSIEHFVEAIDKRLSEFRSVTRLQHYRKAIGLSQSELARKSGVPLRQIQLFEQRQRSINRTQADTLLRLSKALYCSMNDLLETE